MELVSVVLPVYKIESKILEISLDSIINQTYKNLEIIIIFDICGIKDIDKKIELMLSEKSKDNRIKILEGKNEGFVSALNYGISMSNGKYIARMDADDISEKNRIEKQVEFIEKKNIDILGSFAKVISKNKIIGTLEPPIENEDIRKKILLHNPILHSSLIIKKEVLDKIGNYDQNFLGAEDYELYTRGLFKGFKLGNIPEYLVSIRESPESIVRNTKTWKKTREAYIRTKQNAVKNYGIDRFMDRVYCSISPLSKYISPKMSLKVKWFLGWYKK